MMDQEGNELSSEGHSGDFSKFITEGVESSIAKRTEAEKRLKHERKRCQELVNGNEIMERLFEGLNRDIFIKQHN